MRIARPLAWCLLLLAAGCKSTPKSETVTVHVRDAETHAMLDGATVHLSELRADAVAREATTLTTQGVAQLKALPDEIDAVVTVSAKGYLTEAKPLYELKREIPHALAGPVSSAEMNAVTPVTLDLYAAPRPTIELQLLPGFRGLIKVEFQVTVAEGSPRLFKVPVEKDGTAIVKGPGVIHYAIPQDFRAIASDGTAVLATGPLTEDRLRWVKTTDTTDYFVFGTEADCKEARATLSTPDAPHGSGGKGGGGGKKGGGRRGGGRSGMSSQQSN